MVSMRCKNCGNTLQEFRELTEAEQEFVRPRIGKDKRLGAYYRCARAGCRRYQRRGDHNDGGSFPPPE